MSALAFSSLGRLHRLVARRNEPGGGRGFQGDVLNMRDVTLRRGKWEAHEEECIVSGERRVRWKGEEARLEKASLSLLISM